jgi:hypothetical protein
VASRTRQPKKRPRLRSRQLWEKNWTTPDHNDVTGRFDGLSRGRVKPAPRNEYVTRRRVCHDGSAVRRLGVPRETSEDGPGPGRPRDGARTATVAEGTRALSACACRKRGWGTAPSSRGEREEDRPWLAERRSQGPQFNVQPKFKAAPGVDHENVSRLEAVDMLARKVHRMTAKGYSASVIVKVTADTGVHIGPHAAGRCRLDAGKRRRMPDEDKSTVSQSEVVLKDSNGEEPIRCTWVGSNMTVVSSRAAFRVVKATQDGAPAPKMKKKKDDE